MLVGFPQALGKAILLEEDTALRTDVNVDRDVRR